MNSELKKTFIALLIFPVISFLPEKSSAQSPPLLSLDQAISIGLKQNYQMIIDSNNVRASSINNSLGSAGFLPRLDLIGDATFSGQNINQKFSNGSEINKNGVSNKSQSAGAYLTWTLFDGMNMFATAKYLKLQEEQAGNVSNENIQNLIANIMDSYYLVVQQKQLLRLIDSSIKYYDVALTTAKNLQLNGKGTRQQVLQAQIDLNGGKAQEILQKNNLAVQKVSLNQLLQRNPDADFDVIDTIPLIQNFTTDTTELFLREHNPTLMLANKEVDVQTAILQQNRSLYFPNLDFNADYAYSNSSSSASFFLKNQNQGWGAGLTLSWNIFNGMQTREQVQISKINMDNARWQYRQVLSDTKAGINSQLKNYKAALDEMVLLRENLNLAYENLQLATEQYKLFAITQVELQSAHKSFDDAGAAYIASVYAVKKVETNLLLLTGALVR